MTHARSPGPVRETRKAGRITALLITLTLGLLVAACGTGSGSGAPGVDEPMLESPGATIGY